MPTGASVRITTIITLEAQGSVPELVPRWTSTHALGDRRFREGCDERARDSSVHRLSGKATTKTYTEWETVSSPLADHPRTFRAGSRGGHHTRRLTPVTRRTGSEWAGNEPSSDHAVHNGSSATYSSFIIDSRHDLSIKIPPLAPG